MPLSHSQEHKAIGDLKTSHIKLSFVRYVYDPCSMMSLVDMLTSDPTAKNSFNTDYDVYEGKCSSVLNLSILQCRGSRNP